MAWLYTGNLPARVMMITPLHHWISRRIGISPAVFDRQQLEQWQFTRLLQIIEYTAQRSPFYRSQFAGLGSVASLQDFCRVPYTNAENLIANPAAFVCVSQEEVHRIVSLPTSGTTARAKRIFFSQADQALTVDFFKVGMSTLATEGDRVLILLPGERPGSVGDLLFSGLKKLGCVPIKYGPVDDEEKVLRVIREENVNVLVGAPVHLYRAACFDYMAGILPRGQIRAALVSTDVLPAIVAARLKAFWGCEVFDHYGMTETGLGGGVECSAHLGYHMREVDLYIEIIDPESGEALPDGEEGEVVITTLTRNAMPLVRYRTGDISHVNPGICECGSFIKRLAQIKRRRQGGIQIGDHQLFQNDLDEALFQIDGVCDFEAYVLASGQGKDKMKILLRTMGITKDVEAEVREAVTRIPGMDVLVHNDGLYIEVAEKVNTVFAKRKIVDLRPNEILTAQASR